MAAHTPISQEVQTDTLSVKVYFRRGYSVIDTTFHQNASALKTFATRYNHLMQSSPNKEIYKIEIASAASPDGAHTYNLELARKRGRSIIEYLNPIISDTSAEFDVVSKGIDWATLDILVSESDIEAKEKALDIIRNTPELVIENGKYVDGRTHRLKMLRGGRPYNWMLDNIFPDMRYASISIVVKKEIDKPSNLVLTQQTPEIQPEIVPEQEEVYIEEPVVTPAPEQHEIPQITPAMPQRQRKPVLLGMQSNLLFDMALVPNLGMDIWLGNDWSLNGSWMYSWWKINGFYRHTYGGNLELRRWYDPKNRYAPLNGHHFGAYIQGFTYDFETAKRGYLGDEWHLGGGVSYGYSLPLARRLNLDMTVGFGYLTGTYKEYNLIDGHHVWQGTKRLHWFGPTKAEVSLTWLIGNGGRKGGER